MLILLTRHFILTIIMGEGPITTALTATIVPTGMDLLAGVADTTGKGISPKKQADKRTQIHRLIQGSL
jgi:hypothetical protein